MNFNKNFFEPIIEEDDADIHNIIDYETKQQLKARGRHLTKMDSMGRLGIVPGMDKETVISPRFKK
jgi:hypothetical protein